ncbi:hypothetical protein CK203_034252 [Vitis vinifera]|uniref:Uncharacterized protein n=1 Tax=Vitis vinifera TaxID=29760 RepID=A0A438INT7_VITVI|nr:hypothetical protein CK203_034252 [Vitis vinifera]
MMTANRATCIVFSDDDLPPEGSDHMRPLYISVGCSGRRVPSVLLDNGSALNADHGSIEPSYSFFPSSEDFGDGGFLPRLCSHVLRPAQQHGGARYYAKHVLSSRYGPGTASAWPSEFMAFSDRDVPFGLDSFPMRTIAYGATAQGEAHAPSDGIIGGLSTTQEAELQRLVQQLQLSDGAPGPSTSIGDIVDGAVPHDEYVDEMLAMSLSQTEEIAPSKLASPFDLFWCPSSRSPRRSRLHPSRGCRGCYSCVDLFDGPIGLVKGASDLVDPPLSFDVLIGICLSS